MSWNVSGVGTKAAVKKEVARYLDPMIESTKGTPNESAYAAAKTALIALVDSAPDEMPLLSLESWGSAGHGSAPWLDVHIVLKGVLQTFKE